MTAPGQGQFVYDVDMAICIDATGSMAPVIDRVKDRALRFQEDLMKAMEAAGKKIDALRVRVIAFRDYFVDTEPMKESPFFTLPQEKEAFSSFVSSITADGGGDAEENGLEALALAIRSDWTKGGDKRRHIIVVWTDVGTHQLEKAASSRPKNYPSDIPANLDQLTD